MNNSRLFSKFSPFMAVGIGIVICIAFIILMAYALFWGVIIGAVLYTIANIKKWLSGKKKPAPQVYQNTRGRVIEHDDI